MKASFDPIWRKAYEIPAVVTWVSAAAVMIWASRHSGEIGAYPLMLATLCLVFATVRAFQVIVLWEKKARVTHLPDFEMSGDQIMKRVRKAQKKAKRGKLRIDE